jgi:ribosome assembly protein 1
MKLTLDMAVLKDSSMRRGTATITSPTGDVTIRIRTRPLPTAITAFLLKHAESMQHFLLDRRSRIEEDVDLAAERITVAERLSIAEFRKAMEEILITEGGEWKSIIDR